jgi:hypothetical protein
MIDYEYMGGGYFREKGVTKGNVAEIVHAPELVARLKEQLAECARARSKRSKDEIIRVVRGLTLGTDADYEAVLEFCLELAHCSPATLKQENADRRDSDGRVAMNQ